MSYAISRRGLRTATAIGAASLGLLALSACQKPTPLATATVNGDSVHTEASCYDDGKTIPQSEAKKCLGEKADESITVGAGDKVRLGVEPETADTGWLVFVNGQPALPKPVHETYYSFPGDAFFQQQSPTGQSSSTDSAQVAIVATEGGAFKGVWHLKLKNAG